LFFYNARGKDTWKICAIWTNFWKILEIIECSSSLFKTCCCLASEQLHSCRWGKRWRKRLHSKELWLFQ
jgi:hypothetical protein